MIRPAVGDDAALFENQHAVGVACGEREIMHDGKHGASGARGLPQ